MDEDDGAACAAVEEDINKSRSPAEQVRIYTRALLAKQISLEAAEKDVVAACEYLERAEKEVRECRHVVEKLTHELSAATNLSAISKPQHLMMELL